MHLVTVLLTDVLDVVSHRKTVVGDACDKSGYEIDRVTYPNPIHLHSRRKYLFWTFSG